MTETALSVTVYAALFTLGVLLVLYALLDDVFPAYPREPSDAR